MDPLLQPHRVANLDLRNRIVAAPVSTRLSGPDGRVSSREVGFQLARARGGAALVLTGPFLASTVAAVPAGLLRLDEDAALPGVERLVRVLHEAGAAVGAQLTVGPGRLAPRGAGEPVSASAVPTPDGRVTRALGGAELAELVADVRLAGARLAAAGVDLVAVDARGGGLVEQFLSQRWNARTDAWGGDLAGRAGLLVALVGAVRAGAPDATVAVRLALDHRTPGGRDLAEFVELARLLAAEGVDLVGTQEADPLAPWVGPQAGHRPPAANLADAACLREEAGVPVMAAGGLGVAEARRAVEAGIDLVVLGRALIADPELPARLAAGRPDRIRPCVLEASCLDAVRAGRPLQCTANPLAGCENLHAVRRTSRPRHVVVVGGGPAGLEAARVAATRPPGVALSAAPPALGGALARTARPGFKSELLDLVAWYRTELRELDVTVHLSRPVRMGSSVLAGADAVVLATGARPVRPEITGVGRAEVIDVLDVHDTAPGRRVVVIGGGLSGADGALDLADRGHAVTLVEAGDEIAPGGPATGREALLARLASAGVPVLTETHVSAIDDDGVHAVGPDGPLVLRVDTVVLAVGVLPRRDLAVEDELEDPRVHLVGDAVAPGSLGDAVRAGFAAGLAI
jgi:2,4-dienoyl-CoA reductase-like NADH-dependent reductase (Old Yellow Enzyme family)/thioredoxin reductase